MATKKSFFSRFRLIYRPSSPMLKGLVLATVILSTVTLLTLGAIIRDTNDNTEALRQQAGQLLPENEKLQDKIDNLGTVDSRWRPGGSRGRGGAGLRSRPGLAPGPS